MSLPEKYLDKVLPSLSPYSKKKFKSGWGYTLACPFCSPAQKRESKANEKCASLYPVEGSPYLMFSCSRGMNGGTQGLVDCSRRTRLDTFIKHWHPEMHRHWMREKEMAKRDYRPDFKQQRPDA